MKFQTIRKNLIKAGAIKIQGKNEKEREEIDVCVEGIFLIFYKLLHRLRYF